MQGIRPAIVGLMLSMLLAGCGGGGSNPVGSSGNSDTSTTLAAVAATPTAAATATRDRSRGGTRGDQAELDGTPATLPPTLSDDSSGGGAASQNLLEPTLLDAAAAATPTPLPSTVQLPTASLPTVLDQGYIGSCGAFAIGYELTTFTVCKVSGANPRQTANQSSPAYMYAAACIKRKQTAVQNQADGTTAADYSSFLVSRGSRSDADYPYIQQNSANPTVTSAEECASIQKLIDAFPSPDPSFEIGSMTQVKNPTDGIAGNSGVNPLRAQIAAGRPVAILVNEYNGQDNWYNKKSTDVFAGGVLSGDGHWMMVVGYDDNIPWTFKGNSGQGAFLIQNSWGLTFGDKGYWWMSYPAFAASVWEAYVMAPATPPATPAASGGQFTVTGGSNPPAGRVVSSRQSYVRTATQTTVFMIFNTQLDRGMQITHVRLTPPGGSQTFAQSVRFACHEGDIHFSRKDGSSFQPGTYHLSIEARDLDNPGSPVALYKATLAVPGLKAVPQSSTFPDTLYGPTGLAATVETP